MYHYKANCIYGYYGKKVDVYTDKNLKHMPYAQAGVNIKKIGDSIVYTLVSYETDVIDLIGNKLFMLLNPAYSRSTIKHVSAFLKEYAPSVSYYELKEAYKDGKDYVIIKG